MLVVVLTRSLRRLAASAEQLSDPKAAVEVAGGGCREVTLLAGSLRDMATRLRDDAARFQTILRAAGEGIAVAVRRRAHRGGQPRRREDVRLRPAGGPDRQAGQRPDRRPGPATPATDGARSAPPRPISRGSPYFDAVRGVRKDGSVFWLEVTLRPVALRDRQVVTCVFRDVSQKKAAEEQIKGMNEELENRVRLRTARAGGGEHQAGGGAATGRGRRPGQGHVRRQHEPRAAAAAAHRHRLHRGAQGGGRRTPAGRSWSRT